MTEDGTNYHLERQRQELAQISRTIERDVPTVVLNYTDKALALSTRLQIFHPDAITYFDDLMNVDI